MGKTGSSTIQLKPVNGFLFEPEMVFLRDCLSACLFPGETQLVPPGKLDWERFHALLTQNKLVGLFAKLGKKQPGLWPRQLAEQLRNERYSLMIHGDWCEKQAKIVLMALREANITTIVLKGWALVQILYTGEYNLRPSSDMDVLVNPSDVSRLESILTRLVYRDAMVEPWPGYSLRYLNSRHYLSPQTDPHTGQPFELDIHWSIPDLPYYSQRTPVEPYFARSQSIKITDIDSRVLSTEDHVIYACSHISHHGYISPISEYYEIAAILLRSGLSLDWEVIFSRSSELKVLIPSQRVLTTIADLWPGIIPPSVNETLLEQKPSQMERWVDGWVIKSNGKEKFIAVLAWFTIPGLFRKIGYSLETLFPGPAFLKEYYGPAPLGLWPLLYLKRLAMVIFYWLGR